MVPRVSAIKALTTPPEFPHCRNCERSGTSKGLWPVWADQWKSRRRMIACFSMRLVLNSFYTTNSRGMYLLIPAMSVYLPKGSYNLGILAEHFSDFLRVDRAL